MPYGWEKRQPTVTWLIESKLTFLYSSMSANLVACGVFFLEALDKKRQRIVRAAIECAAGLAEGV
jgi:hypothetical protein